MKSERNKTIDFNTIDGREYLKKAIKVDSPVLTNDIINKTIIGDTFKVLDNLPDKFVDLLIVDPYYNLNKNFNGNKFTEKTFEEYDKYTTSWIEKVLPKLKDNATVYVCCDWKSSITIGNVLSRYFIIQNRITWQREKGRGAKSNWKNSLEYIWFCTVSKNYTFNVDSVKQRRKVIAPYKENGAPKDWFSEGNEKYRDSYPSNFWDDISIPYWSMPENTAHPTQKPEKLIAKLILASSNEKDVVFDPFVGSGTTSVVAKKLNRKYVGIEQNETYVAWAEYRLSKAESDKSIQGYKDKVFWERNTKQLQDQFVK